jgi:hypothetical protein
MTTIQNEAEMMDSLKALRNELELFKKPASEQKAIY